MRLGTPLLLGALLSVFALWNSSTAVAQSTDGYHAIQVFPIVLDSASFAQRFHFRATASGDVRARLHQWQRAQPGRADAQRPGHELLTRHRPG